MSAVKETILVSWSCNLKALITEEIQCNSRSRALTMPWKITYAKLLDLANLARRIGNNELHLMMCELGLYTVGDGYHKDYDPKIMEELRKRIHEEKDNDNSESKR